MTDVVPTKVDEVERLISPEEVFALLTSKAVTDERDPLVVQQQIAARILNARTPEEVLALQTLTKAEDVLDRPLLLEGVRWELSDIDEGPGVFAIMSVVDVESGRKLEVACGGISVMAQLYRLQQLDALPLPLRIWQAEKTARGYYPLWLQPIDPKAKEDF